MENIIYEEKQRFQPIFLAMNLATIFVLGYLVYYYQLFNQPIALIVMIFAAGLLILASFSFNHLHLCISRDLFKFRFAFMKQEVYVKNIVDLEIHDYKFSEFGGFGFRHGRNGVKGFIARQGSGIRFKDKNSQQKYFISTSNPDQIVSVLSGQGAQMFSPKSGVSTRTNN
ncbi:hypothetical protein A2533_03695 [Candidatus Falkowbacteria bacterium RIFOXYD2_FULL_35_9]|uniref:Bacterial Pleckstrin homology domain-containing protein n=1 Tax=Candidatus Falkowbacteria bacterium RIFOXYC2_FULL_36_12 TaxID=1798002 RepID=A0A1F5SY76_9BACT|nr:MAG: hypothetical protein A2478_04265 [Candidatus Falkowbacteria bacterium RIFOXYC2_FULL_36_12]OGF31997.1 MAG: hypothetical protein A2300_02510 [Candidatus Falkowbacteria bacterium RIFOXYB2_FULL_35_7]OGF33813.1 MAG: hypothetical protein A2223_03780 [Candidatus Falkowbacteria bacterium RIFOXYA2_FULL_35_8]OGF45936.1 MAG: hypothetical protein A2533_03695 [Candidatus Falkowbacteria bacterium RIFOXYD2_FULL_35_9]